MKYIYMLLLLLTFSLDVHAQPDGKQLYRLHCESCHQVEGEGGIGLPLSNIKLAHVSDRYLEKTIRLGRPGRIMPAYQELSDAQVKSIIRYIRSWSDQAVMTFSTEKITGDVQKGEIYYKKKCSKCHADDGSGEGKGTGVTTSRERRFMIMPAAINNPGYLESVTDQEIRQIIIADRDDSEMPSMLNRLDDQQINDVVAFVRSLDAQEVAFPQQESGPKESLSIVVESPNDFETTVESARQALSGSNFRIFPERFLEQGLIDEFSHNTRQIGLRFCNFKELYDMLNIEPRLGVLLPCRITIMERKDGTVILVAPNMKRMAGWFNNNELSELAETMEETINAVIEEATF